MEFFQRCTPKCVRRLPWSVHIPARCTLLIHCHLSLVISISQPIDNFPRRNSSILLSKTVSTKLFIQISSKCVGFLIVRPDLDSRWFEAT
jgi:hypothetical protein